MNPGNPVVMHFASGAALFSGAILLLLALTLSRWFQRTWRRTVRDALAVLGTAMMFLSATPGPAFLMWMLLTAVPAWIICDRIRRPAAAKTALFLNGSLIILILLMVVLEIPHRLRPTLPSGIHDRTYVLGDSISQGIVKDVAWPKALAQRHHVAVTNLALNGATTADAIKQARGIPAEADLVIIEIGGNDMLGGTPVDQFARDLDKLLNVACRSGRTVVMLELPLPPTFEEWGRVQRGLARKYAVALVPKSYFADVLATPDGTADGLHLSARGADAMADMLFDILGDKLRTVPSPATRPLNN